MKAITLYQPYATLMALGAKRIETRSWMTSYRGQVLICSSRRTPPELIALAKTPPFAVWLARFFDEMPEGKALAIANCTGCFRINSGRNVAESERIFGDYTPGRFGHIYEDVQMLESPIPCSGRQRYWNPSRELINAALAQLKQKARCHSAAGHLTNHHTRNRPNPTPIPCRPQP